MATRGWDDAVAAELAQRRSKYGNRPTIIAGARFDSQKEADFWTLLLDRAARGEITQLRRQVKFPLLCPVEDRSAMVCVYVADFVYVDDRGRRHVVDVKGHATQLFRLKARWLYLQDGITIEEV